MVQRLDGWRLSCEYDLDLYDAVTVNRLIAQLRDLFIQIAANPDRRISEFEFSKDIGDALPPFVPQSAFAEPSEPLTRARAKERPNSSGLIVKKILSRVYTHLGKI
jgi:hypothetical protein